MQGPGWGPSQARRELSERVGKEEACGQGRRGRVAPGPGSRGVCGNQPEMSSYATKTGAGRTRAASALRRLQEPPRVGTAGSGPPPSLSIGFRAQTCASLQPRARPCASVHLPISRGTKVQDGQTRSAPRSALGPTEPGRIRRAEAGPGRARGAGLPGSRPRLCPRC